MTTVFGKCKKGQLTDFGRVPNWKYNAYAWSGTDAAHLVYRNTYGLTMRTVCGQIRGTAHDVDFRQGCRPIREGGDDASETLDWSEGRAIDWSRNHRCSRCEKVIREMRERAIASSEKITEENWKSYYEDSYVPYWQQ